MPTAAPVSTKTAQLGASMLSFAALAKDWVDVRYTVNGGETQTVRMHQDGTGSRYTASGLKRGDVIEYRVTYWDRARQMAVDLAPKTVVMK